MWEVRTSELCPESRRGFAGLGGGGGHSLQGGGRGSGVERWASRSGAAATSADTTPFASWAHFPRGPLTASVGKGPRASHALPPHPDPRPGRAVFPPSLREALPPLRSRAPCCSRCDPSACAHFPSLSGGSDRVTGMLSRRERFWLTFLLYSHLKASRLLI